MPTPVSACSRPTSRRAQPRTLLSLAIAAALGTAAPLPALAQTGDAAQPAEQTSEQRQFNIEGGPLDAVLNRFALEAGIDLSVSTDLTRGKTSPGLQGRYSVEQALRTLLAGSGLSYRFAGENRVTLVAAQAGDGPMRLDPIQVSGGASGYSASYTLTGRLGNRLEDSPQSISVISGSLIEQQDPNTMTDLVLNNASVQPGDNYQAPFKVRGFNATLASDGVRRSFGLSNNSRFNQTANLERVEIIKGPNAILNGSVSPGGTINRITKKPKAERELLVSGSAGFGKRNADRFEAHLDATGALTDSENLSGRLIFNYHTEDSFRDFVEVNEVFVAPSFLYEVGANTSVLVESFYEREDGFLDRGLPILEDGEIAKLDRDFFIGEPDDELLNTNYGVKASLSHRINNQVSASLQVFHEGTEEERDPTTEPFSSVDSDGNINRFTFIQDQDFSLTGVKLDVDLELTTGTLRHELTLGADFNREEEDTSDTVRLDVAPLSVNDPQRGQRFSPPLAEVNDQQDREALDYGFFIQDRIHLLEKSLIFLGGVRYDVAERDFFRTTDNTNISSNLELDFTQKEWSPQAGAVYRFTPEISIYGSYSKSFKGTAPNGDAQLAQGGSPDPEIGSQFEAGLRIKLMEDFSATFSFFDITKEDVVVTDPDDITRQIQIGEQEVQGAELELSGQILPDWDILATLAYNDSEISKDTEGREGKELSDIPELSGSLASQYFINAQWRVGLGVFYRGERFADLDNNTRLDDYVRVDANLEYEYRNLGISLNLRNLFDKNYIQTGGVSAVTALPAAPRAVDLELSYRF